MKRLGQKASAPQTIHIGCTSLGIRISASFIASGPGYVQHYALSCQDSNMTEEMAGKVASLITRLRRLCGSKERIQGNRGVFHLLMRS